MRSGERFEDRGPSLDAQSQADEKRRGFSAVESTTFPRALRGPSGLFFSALRCIILFFFVDFVLAHFDSSISSLPFALLCPWLSLFKILSCESSLLASALSLLVY